MLFVFNYLEGNVVEISSNSPEIGKVEEQIQAESIEGEELKISFSAKYMMDALKADRWSRCYDLFSGAMRPFILKSVHDDSILQLNITCKNLLITNYYKR